jgi:hypothetical protein
MNVCPSLIVNMFDFIGEEGDIPSSFSRHINSKESIEMLISNLYQEKNLKKLIMLLFLHICNIK